MSVWLFAKFTVWFVAILDKNPRWSKWLAHCELSWSKLNSYFRNMGLIKFCEVCKNVQTSPTKNSSLNALARTFNSDTDVLEVVLSSSSCLGLLCDLARLNDDTQFHVLFFLYGDNIYKNDEYMSQFMRKPVLAICKQQSRRSACASAQSDQHLCWSLLR